jgi:hypothetical protein
VKEAQFSGSMPITCATQYAIIQEGRQDGTVAGRQGGRQAGKVAGRQGGRPARWQAGRHTTKHDA